MYNLHDIIMDLTTKPDAYIYVARLYIHATRNR